MNLRLKFLSTAGRFFNFLKKFFHILYFLCMLIKNFTHSLFLCLHSLTLCNKPNLLPVQPPFRVSFLILQRLHLRLKFSINLLELQTSAHNECNQILYFILTSISMAAFVLSFFFAVPDCGRDAAVVPCAGKLGEKTGAV